MSGQEAAQVIMESLVSAIMPACYGALAATAIQCFLNQDYPNRELIVLDNNRDDQTIEQLCIDPRIKYFRVTRRDIGTLRNEGIRQSAGDIICHFDCDDWYSNDRISAQVRYLKESKRSVTGFANILYYQMEPDSTGGTYKYYFNIREIRAGRFGVVPVSNYATGTSQMYTRAWWEKHPFQSLTRGEDYWFQDEAMKAGELHSVDGGKFVVARAHQGSLSPPMLGHAQFPAVDKSEFPQQFFTDTVSAC